MSQQDIAQGTLAKSAIAFLVKNFAEPLSFEDLVRATGSRDEQLAAAFQNVYGIHPMQWLWLFRTITAAEVIGRAPLVPLDQVAAACGFSDAGHFNKCFMAIVGQPPAVFQAQMAALEQAEQKGRRQLARVDLRAARQASVGSALEKVLSSFKKGGQSSISA